MRRTLLATLAVLAALGLPATARGADVLDTYQRLVDERISPAPLVFTTAPRRLTPLDRTVESGSTPGGRGYSIRLAHIGGPGPDAVAALTGGAFKNLRAIFRDHRRAGFGAPRRTRVRGRRGYLFTRRSAPLTRSLVWVEGGVVYSLGSGTPRTVSLADLRSIARGLDRLEEQWVGSSSNPESETGAVAVTTAHTITMNLSFDAPCATGSVRAGAANVLVLRRQGERFAFDIAQHVQGSNPWTGPVTGTISPSSIRMDMRVSGTIDGMACDSGPVTITLQPHMRLAVAAA